MENQEHIKQSQTDHDLLVRIDEKLKILIETQSSNHGDHETRIRAIETQRWLIAGATATMAVIANYAIRIFAT